MTDLIAILKEHNNPRPVHKLVGGVHPPENKHLSNGSPIATPALPKTLVLPLSQHIGVPAVPVVSVGDAVLKGQLIAKADGAFSAALHAPSSGTVTGIELRNVAHPSNLPQLCIELTLDGEDKWCELSPVSNYKDVEPAQLIQKIRDAGISGMGGAGFPTAIKLAPKQTIDTLIINGTECEPYITADDVLMRERAHAIVEGTQILQHILAARTVLVGIENNKPESIAAMKAAMANTDFELLIFPTVYPSGGEKQLIQILTGQEVPTGKLPADLGMMVQNVGTAVAVRDAIIEGKPLISRVTTLTGRALKNPHNVDALIGTSMQYLLSHAQMDEQQICMLIVGGPMMGFAVPETNLPVTKTTNCLIAGTQAEFPALPDAQACIRCGMCAQACPASLLPQQLYWYTQSENLEQLQHHNLFDCIECGACAYVCPSQIPLVQYYRAGKGMIRTAQAKHDKSEHSKARYESRLARLEQEKAEKEAKRQANLARAAALKANPAASGGAEDPVQAALARAKAKKAAQQAATPKAEDASTVDQEAAAKKQKAKLIITAAQLKKTQKALEAAKASGIDAVESLTRNVETLQKQLDALNAEAVAQPEPKPAQEPVTAEKPKDDAALKKLKVEHAMANAQAKKLQRTLDQASDDDKPDLQQQLAQAQEKVAALKKELDAL